MPAHFVLDQNFPWYVTQFPWPPPLKISRLAEIDPELTRDHDDWEILLALDRAGGVEGFITNDADMLQLPREMVALRSTRLALVVTDGVGHEPLRATGLLMVHLEEVARRLDGRPRIHVLRPRGLSPQTPDQQTNVLARRLNVPPNHLISEERARMGLRAR